jgi:hypothetical protein
MTRENLPESPPAKISAYFSNQTWLSAQKIALIPVQKQISLTAAAIHRFLDQSLRLPAIKSVRLPQMDIPFR